ncbi:wsv389 [White spot syndrome virus]|uniref:Wsv389 n=4 Tax=White spot syndrome virus TaxID=342409 RepID=Q8VAL3_WSSVS|nr:wsv389 [Shrimp white spot syndrome virus]AFX59766.1 wsv389 [White spot syndrome virus]AAL33391.1 wsv389 [Shrimp white spot syndrome virus]AAL89316.1 WSSV448 [Shrimp white spot syndrome virus]AWQ60514.1 wsv389 [Shrimp white spot syndrome virus]AWQ60959.1 wsv389 [Shrimp white spot syndrome virus]
MDNTSERFFDISVEVVILYVFNVHILTPSQKTHTSIDFELWVLDARPLSSCTPAPVVFCSNIRVIRNETTPQLVF